MTRSPLPKDWSDDELTRWGSRAMRELQDAPEWLVATTVALWRTPAPTTTQRILAVLRFDSWSHKPALALRAVHEPARHLLFAAEGRDIDLRISPGTLPLYDLQGQVLGPGHAGAVSLTAAGGLGETRSAVLDELGGFELCGVPAGRYRLSIQLDADSLELPELDIGGVRSG